MRPVPGLAVLVALQLTQQTYMSSWSEVLLFQLRKVCKNVKKSENMSSFMTSNAQAGVLWRDLAALAVLQGLE